VANNTSSNNPVPNFYRASAADFKKIPGSPIAYWITDDVRNAFANGTALGDISSPRKGNSTSDNNRFLRYWPELCIANVGLNLASYSSEFRWIPYNKGGGFLKWYGHNSYLIDWQDQGRAIRDIPTAVIANESLFFQPGLTWGTVTTKHFSIRWFDEGFIFDNGGCCIFGARELRPYLMALLNSSVFPLIIGSINPTLNFQSGDVAKFPVITNSTISPQVAANAASLLGFGRLDWDAYERSWDFQSLPLLTASSEPTPTLESSYTAWITQNRDTIAEMKRLEEENNRLFIDAYGLADELTPDVPIEQITLTVNPAYRYGKKVASGEWSVESGFGEELETRFRQDTMDEFISYAVGCMLGRYSLDKPGLILANQGETIEDYLNQIPEPTFMPDEDNVIPILDGDWFTDDIVDRFCQFLRVTFGDTHYQENLTFLENALGKPLRKYFLKDFYASHIKRYKKRPIYWMFSSPKGSFNALIYMHRYTPDTASIVLNDYLREFRAKLTGRKEHLEQISISSTASSRDKTAALREIEKLKTTIAELETYETETLYPLATQRVEIDLDDGVKVNYSKFGNALKKIKGLSKE